MTENYIEIIKRSPYYYQIDGSILQSHMPDQTTLKNGDITTTNTEIWDEWKMNLPDEYHKEYVFLEIMKLENNTNQTGSGSFIETMKNIGILDNEFLNFLKQEEQCIEDIYQNGKNTLIIPNLEYWEHIHSNKEPMETIPQFFLRVSLQHYRNDWTATIMCFHNLLQGKMLLDAGLYTKHQCFAKDTPVWTTQGVKSIQDICIGDKVATHNGRFSRVLKTFKNKVAKRKICEIYSVYGKVAITTYDHLFLVYSQKHKQIIWKYAGHLTTNDYLMRGNINGLHSVASHLFLQDHPVLDDFIHRHPRVVGVAMSRAIGNKGVIEAQYHTIKDCSKNLGVDEMLLYSQVVELLRDIDIRKQIWKWVMETNTYLVIKGWWDIFISNAYFEDQEECELTAMVLNLYNFDVLFKQTKRRNKQIWCLYKRKKFLLFDCMKKNENTLYIQDTLFVRFSHQTSYETPIEEVYTLNIDRDNTYNVNGYIVKNCQGMTPTTMILKDNHIVPIFQLEKGDYILDGSFQRQKIKNITKRFYEGVVCSLPNGSFTPSVRMKKSKSKSNNNQQNETIVISNTRKTDEIQQPTIYAYYDASIEQKTSMFILNFVLKYLCDWDIREENGWCKWKISISDKLFITPTIQRFHSFEYRYNYKEISFKTDVLKQFISKCIFDLLYISPIKLRYFFSYLDRSKEKDTLEPRHQLFLEGVRTLLFQDVSRKCVKKHQYRGDIYDIEMEGHNGFCTLDAIVTKEMKLGVDGGRKNINYECVSFMYVPDTFFQNINISQNKDECDISGIWDDIIQSQLKYGRPSLICEDRNKNECVSGDMRILTLNGVVQISTKENEIVPVWNGEKYMDVCVRLTGNDKKFVKVYFSNGMCLTCTPYHQFFIKVENTIKKVNASGVMPGDEIAPFQLPSISTIDVLPSSIVMTLEWIAKRCVHIENYVVLFEKDIESLRDILLDLQYCGVNSEIIYNTNRDEYELRIDKNKWNTLNHRHINKHISSYIEGDIVKNIKVIKIEETPKQQQSYCFHEPLCGSSVFEGVATGQCENIVGGVCVQGFLDVSKFLKTNPIKYKLKKHRVTVYTTENCCFCRILQREYQSIDIRNICHYEEEWKHKRHTHALSDVPAIFVDNVYVGGFMDFWKHYLCPVVDTVSLGQAVYLLCAGLDKQIDIQKSKYNDITFSSYRPILLHIKGFKEMLFRMRISVDDIGVIELEKLVFETILYAALTSTKELARIQGACVPLDKVALFYDNFLKTKENLRNELCQKGVRNLIFLKTTPEHEENISHLIQKEKELFVGCSHTPKSLQKCYRNEYDVSQKHRLELMKQRKIYNVVDETFYLYITKNTDKEYLSEIEQQIWSHFHTIEVCLE